MYSICLYLQYHENKYCNIFIILVLTKYLSMGTHDIPNPEADKKFVPTISRSLCRKEESGLRGIILIFNQIISQRLFLLGEGFKKQFRTRFSPGFHRA